MPDEPEIIEVEFGGSTYKGTKDEVIQKIGESQVHANARLKELKDQNETLTHTVENLSSKPEPVVTRTDGFDSAKYFKLLAEDPPAAADFLDEHRYGESPKAMRQRLDESHQLTTEVRSMIEINKFRQMVGDDYPGTDEAAQAIWKKGGFDTRPVSAGALLETFAQMKSEGTFKTEKAPPTNGAPRKAPPSARGSQDMASRMTGKDPNAMTAEQIKAEMDRIRNQPTQ